jgi:acyl-CoA reductase-like NAD-dependent aldehyde dehydrogenase
MTPRSTEVRNPLTGEPVGTIALGTAADVKSCLHDAFTAIRRHDFGAVIVNDSTD